MTLPSYGNSPLPYSIEMVLLDEDGGKIYASVKRAFVSRFMNLLEEGISYQIRYFGVGLNNGYFSRVHIMNVVGYLAGIGNERILEKDNKSTKYTVIELKIDDGYRIKFGVINDSDCACFVVFDKEAKQVLGKSCIEILDPLLLKGDLSDTPTVLLNLIDKTFLFIVEVQISDNPHFSPSYKVKKMTDNVDLINKFKEAHPIQINLLLEFSNEVAANDESELLENAITPTKRLYSESEESKVEGDTSTCKKIKIEKET
ncbi:hypothetical protein Ahy_A09g042642 [Arachis hypogaea]|uniref:Replication protein A 70 kDa DNA-binding subunit B/D first OB fold domain-containing protein n=1 Tax=Arachis hypogaea TaxID=3818 RepID=A0A445BGI6_ARAHY|nr:hypothetical protein Ahy_A09g042642 [Arachis hypogaea]